jgi:lipoate-protein ligase A
MILFNHSYNTPIENLAIDEALLRLVDNGNYQEGICRIWESQNYFVVLGLSKKVVDDVHLDVCNKDGIPILKRCSGGGTVLQGPGCFNYGFILPINHHTDLAGIGTTTSYILSMVQERLEPIISKTEQQGISDLVINNIKFSGNAQRRLRNAILFHGTILYDFDLSLVSTYLKEPPIQPDYRKKRPHHQFIRNVLASKSALMEAFITKTKDSIQMHQGLLSSELMNKYQPISCSSS